MILLILLLTQTHVSIGFATLVPEELEADSGGKDGWGRVDEMGGGGGSGGEGQHVH